MSTGLVAYICACAATGLIIIAGGRCPLGCVGGVPCMFGGGGGYMDDAG